MYYTRLYYTAIEYTCQEKSYLGFDAGAIVSNAGRAVAVFPSRWKKDAFLLYRLSDIIERMRPETLFQPAGTLVLGDIRRFQYFHSNHRLWPFIVFVVFFGLLSFLGIVVTFSSGVVERITNPGLFWIVSLLIAVLYLLGPLFGAKRQFARQRYLREPMRYYFTDERLRLEGPNFSSELTLVARASGV